MDFSLSSRSSFSQSQPPPPATALEQEETIDLTTDALTDEATRAQEAYRSGLRRRVAAYEQCVEAVGVLTASLEELSAKVEAMKTSTQQLNAFTSGWLTVWHRA